MSSLNNIGKKEKGKRFQYISHPEAHYGLPPKKGTSYQAKMC